MCMFLNWIGALQVSIIDFGLAKKYRDPKTHIHIPYRCLSLQLLLLYASRTYQAMPLPEITLAAAADLQRPKPLMHAA